MTAKYWTNERGNKVTSRFIVDGDRYQFDFDVCSSKKGWKQYDTTSDAWYFGVWVYIEDRQIVTYAEGDQITVTCDTVESFKAELDHMAEFYGDPNPAFTVISQDGSVTKVYDERPSVKQ